MTSHKKEVYKIWALRSDLKEVPDCAAVSPRAGRSNVERPAQKELGHL